MLLGGKQHAPPGEFWVPDYTDYTLPLKPDGQPYREPEDYEEYLDWLVAHLENKDTKQKGKSAAERHRHILRHRLASASQGCHKQNE